MKKNAWKIFLVVAVILIGGSIMISNMSKQNADDGVVLSENVKGDASATVVLTEYSDFQCPACAQFQPAIEDILSEYGDSIRFEYKHFPLISIHPFAMPAARAAEAAGQQGKFWEMHDMLFLNQSAWAGSANPTAYFVQYAEDLDLDVATFRRHMRSAMIDDKIESDFNEARELGLTGTPSFFLNGEKMQFETYEDFRNAIAFAATGQMPESEIEIAPAVEQDVEFGI